jgi:hypothetical protein
MLRRALAIGSISIALTYRTQCNQPARRAPWRRPRARQSRSASEGGSWLRLPEPHILPAAGPSWRGPARSGFEPHARLTLGELDARSERASFKSDMSSNGGRSPHSNRLMVVALTPISPASLSRVHPSNSRAALTWRPVTPFLHMLEMAWLEVAGWSSSRSEANLSPRGLAQQVGHGDL